ncbi:hypothetical protein FRC08_010211 [Ceratobasidium sp. 394]|nr:hypothetical protein FRC08_010211 [Ceratobasidium sp. 394]
MSICLDNPSNNETFVKCIAPSLPRFEGPEARTRCIAHIANLAAHKRRTVVKSATSAKRPAPGAAAAQQPSVSNFLGVSDDPNDPTVTLDELDGVLELPNDADEGNGLHDQGVVKASVGAKAFERMKGQNVTVLPGELDGARDLFPKVNGFASHILHSSTLQPVFLQIRDLLKGSITTKKTLPSSYVSTRWNSQCDSGMTHIELRPVVEVMTGTEKYELDKYHLSSWQWDLLVEVCECLEVFREPTLLFSQKEVPLIHEVIPSLYTMRFRSTRMLEDEDRRLHSITRVAACSALAVVDKYIGLLEKSELYFMAVALCPWYKLHWFTAHGFSFSRIQEVRAALYKYYEQYYARPVPTVTPRPPDPTPKPKNHWMEVGPVVPVIETPESELPQALSAIDAFLGSSLAKKSATRDAPGGGLMTYWMREQGQGSAIAEMALRHLNGPG